MIIGITGGIGAGKSTVMQYMKEHYSVYTILADDVAKDLQKQGGIIYRQIVDWLTEQVVAEDGELDRNLLASIVFADEEKRIRLNQIVHPAVRTEIERQIAKNCGKYSHIAIEAALLIEEHYEDICDEFWYIDAKDEIRIARLMESRGYTREKCVSIMNQQQKRDVFLSHCDRVIDNSGSLQELKQQLNQLLADS